MREDAGVSQAAVARSAGVNQAYVSRIEAGNAEPSVEVLLRLGLALSADLGFRYYFPNTGPRIRDHLSATMGTALADALHPRWRLSAEVAVYRPVHGVIDAVLEERDGAVSVETELHSQVRRVEQQVRWQGQKADGLSMLPGHEGRRVQAARAPQHPGEPRCDPGRARDHRRCLSRPDRRRRGCPARRVAVAGSRDRLDDRGGRPRSPARWAAPRGERGTLARQAAGAAVTLSISWPRATSGIARMAIANATAAAARISQ